MSSDILTVNDLDEFLEIVADELYTYARNLTRDEDLTADIVQSVFAKFIERVSKGDVERNRAAAYLMRMVRNDFIDFKRKAGRVDRLVLEETLSADQRKVEIETQSRLIRSVFLEAMADPALSDEVVEILRLRFIDEFRVNDICERTGKSRTTVHRLMRKGLDHLMDAFEAAGLNTADLNN